jgi:hypothetical protein
VLTAAAIVLGVTANRAYQNSDRIKPRLWISRSELPLCEKDQRHSYPPVSHSK